MIEAIKLKKSYFIDGKEIKALNNVSVKFEEGKFYAIKGHSGSGKSTLIHCLGLLDTLDGGKLKINNIEVSNMSYKDKAKIRSNKVGFVFQSFYLSAKLTALENVMLPMYINDELRKEDRKLRAIELLKMVGLESRLNHFPKQLSGGEQQRVAIARALANNPEIILADEPTGNLDVDNEEYIMKLLKKLSVDGKCVIMVTHNNVDNYADITFEMQNGVLGDKYEK